MQPLEERPAKPKTMRTRDVTIPLGLWICAAICAHFFLGTGGLVVAKVHDDRSELWKLAREASNLAQQSEHFLIEHLPGTHLLLDHVESCPLEVHAASPARIPAAKVGQ